MNIFHLHEDPKTCAEYHCDKHVVKMILETGQMLSTAYRRHFDGCHHYGIDLYKTAYHRHPMTVWVGNSGGNFSWTMKLLEQLLNQYTLRYNKKHSTANIFYLLDKRYRYWQELNGDFTTPPQCMPDQYKHKDYITAYKQYYIGEKKRFAKYTGIDIPPFLC
jgi:hypothetical protein